jgi:hypothetical protein
LLPGLDAGLTAKQTYGDYDKLYDAWQRFDHIYKQDVRAFSINIVPTRMYEVLDYKPYDRPGNGVAETAGYQYNEKEWMTADEYDRLIADPSDYWQRFLPSPGHRGDGALDHPGSLHRPGGGSHGGAVLHPVRHA